MNDYISADLREQMPIAEESEKAILGLLAIEPHRIYDAAIEPSDFALDSNRRIFLTMKELFAENGSFDTLTVAQRLVDSKEIGAVGGWMYVTTLSEGIPHNMQIDHHCAILKEKRMARQLLSISEQISAKVYGGQESLSIASWIIQSASMAAEEGEGVPDVMDAQEGADDAEDRLLDNMSDEEVIPTGLRCLDEFTGGGIRQGELWIIGASPSRGKTTLARQIVKHATSRGTPSYVHSGEMTKESWMDVTACLIADMPAWKVRQPRLLNLTERENLRAAIRKLAKLPLYISDSGGMHLDRLLFNAARQSRTHKIKLMAVDYAQIVTAPGRDKREQVSEVANRMRQFAKDENIATILLSQSPRPEGRAINTRPNMFSLKETGNLEEAAHTVLLPYRPVDVDTGQFTGEDELIIGKQRWGAIGHVNVNLNGEYLKFEER